MKRMLLLLCIYFCLSVGGPAISGESSDRQDTERKTTTVSCVGEKCRTLDLWNQLIGLDREQFDRLKRLQDSLISDPPGLVVSLDRAATLKELATAGDQLTKIYREMARLEER